MMTTLPWQLWVIVIELWASAVISSIVLSKTYKYTWRGLGWVLSDIAMIALLAWGGNPSWQHVVIGALYAWAIFQRIRKIVTGHVFVPNENADKHVGLTTAFLVVLTTVFTLLVVTG